jgi:hypothetical protein
MVGEWSGKRWVADGETTFCSAEKESTLSRDEETPAAATASVSMNSVPQACWQSVENLPAHLRTRASHCAGAPSLIALYRSRLGIAHLRRSLL